jgi:hypothetical protein
VFENEGKFFHPEMKIRFLGRSCVRFAPFLRTALFKKQRYFNGLQTASFAICDFDVVLNQWVTKDDSGRIYTSADRKNENQFTPARLIFPCAFSLASAAPHRMQLRHHGAPVEKGCA